MEFRECNVHPSLTGGSVRKEDVEAAKNAHDAASADNARDRTPFLRVEDQRCGAGGAEPGGVLFRGEMEENVTSKVLAGLDKGTTYIHRTVATPEAPLLRIRWKRKACMRVRNVSAAEQTLGYY